MPAKPFIFAVIMIGFGLPSVAIAQDILEAARSGDLEALRVVLPAEEKAEAESLASPLYFAAQRGHEDVVAYLLEKGAQPNLLTKSGSALQIAARGNHLRVVSALLNAGADIALAGGEDSKTALHDAAERGHSEAVILLLENGADINARTKWDHPPIHLAARKKRDQVVALLLKKGAVPRPVSPIDPKALEASDPKTWQIEAQICLGCHATKVGESSPGRYPAPNLAGIVGRSIASEPDFPYTDALKALQGKWTVDEINQYIADPTGTVPGTEMGHAGVADAASRTAIIAYLATLSAR